MRYAIEPQTAVSPPVTTDEAKAWLDVDHADDDTMIDVVLQALSERIEEDCGLSLSSRVWIYTAQANESMTALRVLLPREPVTAVDTVKVYDQEGDATTLTADSDYYVLGEVIRFEGGQALTAGGRIEVTFTAGYANSAAVPSQIKLAIRRFCKTHYDVPMDVVIGLIVNKLPIPELDILFTKRRVSV